MEAFHVLLNFSVDILGRKSPLAAVGFNTKILGESQLYLFEHVVHGSTLSSGQLVESLLDSDRSKMSISISHDTFDGTTSVSKELSQFFSAFSIQIRLVKGTVMEITNLTHHTNLLLHITRGRHVRGLESTTGVINIVHANTTERRDYFQTQVTSALLPAFVDDRHITIHSPSVQFA